MRRASWSVAVVAIATTAMLAGCAGGAPEATVTSEPPPPSTAAPVTPSATVAPTTTAPFHDAWVDQPGPVTVSGEGALDVTTGLDAPWSVVLLDSGASLVSERDTGRILEVFPDRSSREVTTVADVAHGGEGGLLGLAVAEGDTADGGAWLFAMFTAPDGNRIVRFDLTSTDVGAVAVGDSINILAGIPRASNHNGGRLAIGPDARLYATAGDAGQPDLAQDSASLAGKILRLELDGSVPHDNPFGSAVYSMGHRNPQGLAWDRDGQLWASEFGQNTWDELNQIQPGANYGWPIVEGEGQNASFTNPVLQWSTSEASPSGLVWVGDTLFMASLRGERLWRIDLSGGEAMAEPLLVGEYGRIRDVIVGPAETLWILTNNTDGRGSPSDGDDRLVQLPIQRP